MQIQDETLADVIEYMDSYLDRQDLDSSIIASFRESLKQGKYELLCHRDEGGFTVEVEYKPKGGVFAPFEPKFLWGEYDPQPLFKDERKINVHIG